MGVGHVGPLPTKQSDPKAFLSSLPLQGSNGHFMAWKLQLEPQEIVLLATGTGALSHDHLFRRHPGEGPPARLAARGPTAEGLLMLDKCD